MAGSYPQYSDPPSMGPPLNQPTYAEPYPSYPFPAQPASGAPGYPPSAASTYSAMPTPPVQYPRRRAWRLLAAVLLVLAIASGAAGTIIYSIYAERGTGITAGEFTPATAKAAIQNYLDALSNGDTDAVARNTLCGMYDAVHDQRADQALAKLASEAFRKQFSSAQVTAIDKMVFLSANQANVLFTMQVAPVSRSSQRTEEQAIAQLLYQDNRVLVCQYLLRSAGQY